MNIFVQKPRPWTTYAVVGCLLAVSLVVLNIIVWDQAGPEPLAEEREVIEIEETAPEEEAKLQLLTEERKRMMTFGLKTYTQTGLSEEERRTIINIEGADNGVTAGRLLTDEDRMEIMVRD